MMQVGVFQFQPQLTGWNLNSGTGQRSFRSPDINFQPPFPGTPQILLALSGIDSEHTANLRITVHPDDIEPEEFNIVVNTWDDTLIHSVNVTWLAFDG
jgi:hypothetical protein